MRSKRINDQKTAKWAVNNSNHAAYLTCGAGAGRWGMVGRKGEESMEASAVDCRYMTPTRSNLRL
jgi:hypothetical protein